MNTFLRNASALFGAHFAAKALSFALIVLLPRVLETDALGDYFVAVAVTSLVGSLAEFGMRDPVIRSLHLDPERRRATLGVAFAMRLSLGVVVVAVCGFVAWIGGYSPRLTVLVWLLAGAEILNGLAQLFWMVFRAQERMGHESIAVLLERGIVVLIGGGVIWFGGDILQFGTVVLAAALANALVSGGLCVRRFVRLVPVFRWAEWRTLGTTLMPFFAANLLSFAYAKLDTILLKELSGTDAVAWYGVAYSWILALTILPGAFMGAAFPQIARASNPGGDSVGLAHLYTSSWKLMLAAGLPIALVTSFCASKLMGFFYPTTKYPPGTIDAALSVLAWVEGILFLSAVVSNTLRGANCTRAIWRLYAATLALNAAANIWAIPRYHHIGAAWSLVLSEGFFVLAGSWHIRRRVTRWTDWRFLPKLVIAGGACALTLYGLDGMPFVVQASAACIVYGGVVWGLNIVSLADLRWEAWRELRPTERFGQ